MMQKTLNEAEKKLAIFLAKSRYQNARRRAKPDMKKGGQTNWETDLEGVGAEIAVCSLLNIYPDLETDLAELPTYDCVTKTGLTIDVKATKYRNGRLIAALWKKNVCDAYVLVIGEFPNYTIVGFLEGKELLDQMRVDDLGHGPVFVADQDELKNINTLAGAL